MARIAKAQLISLQRKFKHDAAIGAQFGISRQAVHQLRIKFGIPSVREDNPKRNREAIKLYKSGKSVTAIAKKANLSLSYTYRMLKRISGKKKGKGGKPAECDNGFGFRGALPIR